MQCISKNARVGIGWDVIRWFPALDTATKAQTTQGVQTFGERQCFDEEENTNLELNQSMKGS